MTRAGPAQELGGVDNARLAVLDAIDARAYADDLARSAGA